MQRSLLLILASLFLLRASSANGPERRLGNATLTKAAKRWGSGAEVIREMNLARQHPAVYAQYLEQLRARFDGKLLARPGQTTLPTREGVAAVDEAVRFLRHARPLTALASSAGIALAAAEHVADQTLGATGHKGADGTDPGARMNRHGVWSKLWGENISYGKSSPREIVVSLIIDDGLPGRKHRKNIFNSAFNFAGAAVGPHARHGTVCSIDFAAGYVERTAARSLFARN